MNWEGERIFGELEKAGWTIYRIAQKLGRKWDTVERWKKIEPRYSDAKAILDLHAEATRSSGDSHSGHIALALYSRSRG